MRHPLARALACAVLVASAGCADMLEPSLLDEPRFLAVQVTPRALQPGQVHQVLALTWEIDEVAWSLCPVPWIPQTEGLTCVAQTVPLGAGNPVDIGPLPAEVSEVYLRADATGDAGVISAVRAVGPGPDADNPAVSALRFDGAPGPARAGPGSMVAVDAELLDPLGTGDLTVSFFTTVGSFDPWRAGSDGSSVLEVPDDAPATTATIIAVVRDPEGGIGWLETTLEIGP